MTGHYVAARQLVSKFKLRIVDAEPGATPWHVDKSLRDPNYVREPKGVLPADKAAMLDEVSAVLSHCGRRGSSWGRPVSYRWWSNKPKYVDAALRHLKYHKLIMCPTDKDGGYAVVPRPTFTYLLARQITPDRYEYSHYQNLDTIRDSFCRCARELGGSL